MSREDDVRLAEHARRLQEDEVLANIFQRMEADLVRKFRATNENEAVARETIHYKLRALESIRDEINRMIDAGMASAHLINEVRTADAAREKTGMAPGDPI